MLLFFLWVLDGKKVINFTSVVLIATYVYKICVYTSCLTSAEEKGTLIVYCFAKWCIFDGRNHSGPSPG